MLFASFSIPAYGLMNFNALLLAPIRPGGWLWMGFAGGLKLVVGAKKARLNHRHIVKIKMLFNFARSMAGSRVSGCSSLSLPHSFLICPCRVLSPLEPVSLLFSLWSSHSNSFLSLESSLTLPFSTYLPVSRAPLVIGAPPSPSCRSLAMSKHILPSCRCVYTHKHQQIEETQQNLYFRSEVGVLSRMEHAFSITNVR